MFSEVERRGLAVLVDQAGDVVLGVHAVLVRVDDVREGALSADYSEAAVEGARDGPMNGSLCAGRVLAYGLVHNFSKAFVGATVLASPSLLP